MADTICIVTIDGREVSSNVMPYLQTISIELQSGASSHTASMTFDDESGQLLFPQEGVSLQIELGTIAGGVDTLFTGVVDEVRSEGARGGGRTLTVSAKGVDTKGKAKEPKQKHWDDKDLKTVLDEAGKAGGMKSVEIDEDLGSIKRKYWSMQGESFLHFAERIAKEVGGTFTVADGKATLSKRNGGTNGAGKTLPTVRAAYGDNLINWQISPVMGRNQFKEVTGRWYDRKEAKWKEKKVDLSESSADAGYSLRYPAYDEDEADRSAQSRKTESERQKGEGTVEIDGAIDAMPEGTCIVVGARDGIDGTYRIESVSHTYSRDDGFTTKLDLKQPQGDAGKDTRSEARGSSRSGAQSSSRNTVEAGSVPPSSIG